MIWGEHIRETFGAESTCQFDVCPATGKDTVPVDDAGMLRLTLDGVLDGRTYRGSVAFEEIGHYLFGDEHNFDFARELESSFNRLKSTSDANETPPGSRYMALLRRLVQASREGDRGRVILELPLAGTPLLKCIATGDLESAFNHIGSSNIRETLVAERRLAELASVEQVLPLLNHVDSRKRLAAARVVTSICKRSSTATPVVAAQLIELLRSEPDPNVGFEICNACGYTRSPAVIGPLIEVLTNDKIHYRLHMGAQSALERLGALAVPQLVECLALQDKNNFPRRIQQILVQLGSAARPGLLAGLENPSEQVRKESAEILKELNRSSGS